MQETFLTIIIKDNISISAIDAIQRQPFANWECIIANNSVENLEKYIADDSRFLVLSTADKIENVNTAIQKAKGKYIIIINSDDIFVQNAFSDIFYMADLTDAPVIKYGTDKNVSEVFDDDHKCIFQYVIKRDMIIESVFDNLSGFCFQKDIIQKYKYGVPEQIFTMNIVCDASTMTKTNQICLLQSEILDDYNSSDYVNIIDNFQKLKNKFPDIFWKKYFGVIIPNLTRKMMTNQSRADFVYCCGKIPLKFVPSRYKFMYFLFKHINK